jgi:tight adherence protein B
MIPGNLLGLLLGLMLAAAVMLVVVGFMPPQPKQVSPKSVSRTVRFAEPRRIAIAVAIGIAVAVVAGWVVLGAAAGVAVFYIPASIAASRAADREHERIRALAQWIEIIRDSLRSASGIEEAVIESASLVSRTAIADEVQLLRVNTETRGIRAALVDFGESMSDPVSDQVVWALTIAVDRPSASISEVLSRAATTARSQVSRRERVHATRARIGTIVNMVFGVTALLGLFLIGTQPAYQDWYSTFVGQTFLLFGLGLQLLMYRLIVRIGKPRTSFRTPINSNMDTNNALSEVYQ